MRRGLVLILVVLACLPSSAAAQERVLGALECAPTTAYRVCTGGLVPSWDGARIDTDVYLPLQRQGPVPLVAILTGYPARKASATGEFLMASASAWARRGYAVLTLAPRGMTTSCGPQAGCPGESHLADSRYEARDVQHLAGVLADEGVADPARIGVVGESYGGGTALQLAVLRDRVHLPDGAYTPWRSPGGQPMRIAAAAPLTTWNDLAGSLVKGGREGVIGVPLASYFTAFTAVGIPDVSNTLLSQASLQRWWATMEAGEPFSDAARAEMREFAAFHSAAGIALDGAPAPTILANGLTDDLFPVQEVRRHVARLPAGAVFTEVHGEFGGHGRTFHDPGHAKVLRERVAAFFDHHLRDPAVAPPTGVEVLLPTCGSWTGARFRAADWASLAPRAIVLRSPAPQLAAGGGSPLQGRALDPAVVGSNRCSALQSRDAAGAATYRWPAGDRLLLGAAQVSARLAVTGAPAEYAQVAARLWDVDPTTGTQLLVTRALHRPRGGARETFELNATAYRFRPGHVAKLELMTGDAPYARPSNLPFTVLVSDLELRLPTR
jgi:hypothetical protein